MSTNATPLALADDLIYGDAEIAEFLGLSPRRVNYLISSGAIPSGRVGRIHVCSKTKLREHFETVSAGQDAAAA